MTTEKRRLGRGLETLLGRIGTATPDSETLHVNDDQHSSSTASAAFDNKIDVMRIEANPFQPRQFFDDADLEELARSLDMHGLMQPIVVRPVGDRYQIVAGERRFRAALRMGWSDIAVQICEADDQTMAELALTENIQRKDLNAIEKATSFANYLELYPDTTHEELANRLAIQRSTVSNLLRLLDLPTQLQDAVVRNDSRLTAGHARALLALSTDSEQINVAEKIQTEGWSVRETERFVQDLIHKGEAESPKNPEERTIRIADHQKNHQSEQIRHLEEELRRHLGGVKVQLTQSNDKGKGKLVISFSNHEEFERIYAAIGASYRAAG